MSIEVVACSVSDAIAAVRGGARRLEVCSDIGVGGVTPPVDLVAEILAAVSTPVVAMVRPRAGDFVYSATEVDICVRQAEALARLDVEALVFGALTPSGEVDEAALGRITEIAPVVFHRAFDRSRDVFEALSACLSAGVLRILTSGAAPTAQEGAPVLAALRDQAAARIDILPGGSIRPDNAAEIRRISGSEWMHLSAHVPKVGGEVSETLVSQVVAAWESGRPA